MTDIITPQAISYPYNAITLTQEMELYPNLWGRLQDLNLFPAEPIDTTMVEVGYSEGEVFVLELGERGQPGTHGSEDPEGSLVFKVPGAVHYETITPRELQDRFEFGTNRQQRRSVDTATAKKLAKMRQHFGQTLEFTRMQAAKGIIKTGKGRVLYNLFEVFGLTQKVLDLKLGTASTDVFEVVTELVEHVADNLMGETMSGIRVLCDGKLFDRLVNHASVEKYYLQHAGAVALVNAKLARVLQIGDVTFEVYRGWGTNIDRERVDFIEPTTGHAFPEGTMNTFRTYLAPADHIEHVNRLGTEIFVSPKILDHGAGVELQGQSHPLPLCKRPALLVKVISSN